MILLNFGGPRSVGEVRRFLFEILRDPNTLQFPMPRWAQDALAWLIARRRRREIERQYGEIGGQSPIVAATERIAAALRQELAGRSLPLPVYVAHRYLRGHARAAARQMVADGVRRILAVPLYPHFSYASTGSSLEQLVQELAGAGFSGAVSALRSYPEAAGFVEAHAARLRAAVAQAGLLQQGQLAPDTLILCSAHGLPQAYVERGDPYRLELYRTVAALRRECPGWDFALSFQSRVGPAQWLKPYTDHILSGLAARGVKHLVFLPISFVNDHLETLFEIGHTYVQAAQRLGMQAYRVPAVEDHPALVRQWAQAVLDWRGGLEGTAAGELLPPDQWPRRVGWWLWSAWLATCSAMLVWACRG